MAGLVSLIGIFFRYLWPFIKEWFFDKRTILNWLRKNYIPFIMTIVILVLGFMNFKMLMYSVDIKDRASAVLDEHEKLTEKYEDQTKRAGDLMVSVKNLTDSNEVLLEKIDRYERWMSACGMDYTVEPPTVPRCRMTVTPTQRHTPTGRRSSGGSKSKDTDVVDRVKQIWGQTK